MIDSKRVLEDLRPLLETEPEWEIDGLLDKLRQFVPCPISSPAVVEMWEETVMTEDAGLRIRLYRPLSTQGKPLGGIYWIHGGGMAGGGIEMDDLLCERFAVEAGCVVASVEYRLAPEHPYPVPVEDCYAGLVWFAQQAAHLGVDPGMLAVAGASAGGGLCAAVTLMARDRKGPELFFQMPLCPMLDDRNNTPSAKEVTMAALPITWNSDTNRVAWDWYLGGMCKEEVPCYAAPARAKNLSGLPPAYTCVGQLDPFRDETITYVQRLCQAGVDVEFHLYPGAFHGFDQLALNLPSGNRASGEYIEAMARRFARRRRERSTAL